MKQTLVAAIVLSCTIGFVEAQDRGLGLGIIVGEPTGLSAKVWTTSSNAVQLGMGWTTVGGKYSYGTRIDLTADYLWHNFEAIRSPHRLPVYYGIGAALTNGGGNAAGLGARGVVGVAWLSREVPLDVFLEVVPVMQIVPSTNFGVEAGLGVRFYFN